MITRKATGFKSLQITCWEMNQVTLKCQIDLDKICKRKSKTKEKNITIKFYIFEIVYQLKLTILNIWTKLTQKGYFQSKKEENENHHQILDIRISLGSKYLL